MTDDSYRARYRARELALLGVTFERDDSDHRARELAVAYSMTIDPARRLRLLGRLADLVGEDEADRLIDWAMGLDAGSAPS